MKNDSFQVATLYLSNNADVDIKKLEANGPTTPKDRRAPAPFFRLWTVPSKRAIYFLNEVASFKERD